MTRSLKKGPYVDEKLENRLVSMSGSKKKRKFLKPGQGDQL
jgi:ribosomal protein S19